MNALTLVGLLALLAFLFVRYAMSAPPGQVASVVRSGGPIALMGLGGLLTIVGRGAIGVPLIAAGFGLRRFLSGTPTNPPATSRVRSGWLEVELDHETGDMNGVVLQGVHEGAELDSMTLEAIRELAVEIAASGDEESRQLLEAYLDRRAPGWREGAHGDEAGGLGTPEGAGAMSEKEAYEVLGLAPGASVAEIREAHRRLMKRAHPDAGGSAELAARLNEAKDILLRGHG